MTRSFSRSLGPVLTSALLLAAVSSCSSAQDSSTTVHDRNGGSSTGGTTSVSCDDSGNLDLDGTFALSGQLSFTFTSEEGGAVTVCPVDQTSSGTVLGLAHVEHEAGSKTPTITVRVCSIELPEISAIVGTCDPEAENMVYAGIEFPQPVLDAFATLSPATSEASLSALTHGAAIRTGQLAFGVGTRSSWDESPMWQSENQGCGALDLAAGRGQKCEQACVTSCDDVTDDDNDGAAGVTVHVCGYTREDRDSNVPCNADEPSKAGSTLQGNALMTIHVSDFEANGTATSSCELSGQLDAEIHYQVVGADLYLANAQISVTSAIKSLPKYRVNKEQSRFRMLRIDGKHGSPDWSTDSNDPTTACRVVIAHQNDLQ